MKKLLALLLLASFARAGDIVIGNFQGLNTNDNPVTLEDGEAQDLLNVGITPGGKSVYKREGYGLHKTLSYSTSAVHGLYYFQDSAGSSIHLYGHDAYLAASVNGASPVDISTGTVNATWQCTDNFGYAYCVNSSRDTAVRTSGTSATTSFIAGIPKGTMITSTPDRLVVAGVSGAESSLYFSQANTFTNFTVGINSADPFIEVINSPGSRITHIRYACGKVLWWKDGSFGYTLGSDQYNLEDVVISPNIGTLDNSSDEYNGIVYFRGQDNHIYQYDCSNVTRLSRKITPTVQGSSRRRSNSWTQSSKADFDSGSFAPSSNFSTSLVSGAITVSSITQTDTASADFSQGTGINITYQSGDIIISTNAVEVPNHDFETSNTSWTVNGSESLGSYWGYSTGGAGQTCTLSPKSGSQFLVHYPGANSTTMNAFVIDALNGTSYGNASFAYADTCVWSQKTISVSASAVRRPVKIRFYSNQIGSSYSVDSATFTANGNNVSFWGAGQYLCSGVPACSVRNYTLNIDTVSWSPESKISSASYTSRTFDTGYTQAIVASQANWTVNTSTPYVEIQTSANGSTGWTKLTTSTNTSGVSNRYVRYVSSFSLTQGQAAQTSLDDVTLIAKSTGGVYFSAVNNASSLSQWSTFGVNQETGGGSIVYYVRASTGQFTVLSSTPVWVLQSVGATVNYATGTYMQTLSSFTVTSATSQIELDDFTFNWTEGNSIDKAYVKYWNDYVWVAVSSGTAGLNNRIQRWDILNQTWLLDDIGSNGFLVDNDDLYFGSPSAGKIYKYGAGVTTDDSSDITSYWKSKDFGGDDPFVTKSWDQADFVVKAASPTIMDVVYQLDGSTSTVSYTVNLYHPTKTILHKGVNLSGKLGWFYNVRFGDTSDHPAWEVFGYRAKYSPWTWRPE